MIHIQEQTHGEVYELRQEIGALKERLDNAEKRMIMDVSINGRDLILFSGNGTSFVIRLPSND